MSSSSKPDEENSNIVSNGSGGGASSSQYGSIERRPTAEGELPPKPAARQRTTTTRPNSNSSNNHHQDLAMPNSSGGGGNQVSSISSETSSSSKPKTNNTRQDELNRELQAELSKKLSLARSRLEQANQLTAMSLVGQQQQQQQQNNNNTNNTRKLGDLSLSLELPPSSELAQVDDRNHLQQAAAKEGQLVNHATDGSSSRPYPKKVLFIIANEFCERFSYYGLRTVLILYLKNVLGFTDSNSTISFHLFTMLCYVTPILGAILGDSILGKFRTIFYLSVVYFLGELILVISSVFWDLGPASVWTTFAGLFLIGLGTGGIKPCVSALGGDQFLAHEHHWRQSFFSLFYAAINLGSLISTFVTPILRSDFHCVGRADCFPLAFGLPCALMLVAIVVFLMAKNQYYLAPLPEENVLLSFCGCIWLALKRKLAGSQPKTLLDDNLAPGPNNNNSSNNSIERRDDDQSTTSSDLSTTNTSNEETLMSSQSRLAIGGGGAGGGGQKLAGGKRRSHWLYLASDRFDSKSIEAFRSVLGILLLFIPTLVYWSLFDQQASLWTLQATRMDGHLFNGAYVIQPDQMSVANPLILLAMIPIFEGLVYPGLARCGLLTKPIQRMTTGGFMAALAFLAAATLELRIQQFQPASEPPPGFANLILVNGLRECSVINPMISHLQLQAPAPLISVNQSSATTASNSIGGGGGGGHAGGVAMRLNSLESLGAQSVEIQSMAAANHSSYQLQLSLASGAAGPGAASTEQPAPAPAAAAAAPATNRSFGCPIDPKLEHQFQFAAPPEKSTRLLYLELGNGRLAYKMFNESLELPPAGRARVRLLYEFFGSSAQAERRQFYLLPAGSSSKQTPPSGNGGNGKGTGDGRQVALPNGALKFTNLVRDGQVLLSDYVDIEVPAAGGQFSISTTDDKLIWVAAAATEGNSNNSQQQQQRQLYQSISLEPGTRNLLIVHQADASHVWLKQQLLQDNKYRISILYQLIPYTLISASEVMFSITGLEFSYSMAPASMKSVLLASWSLTIAFGNLLTVFVESLHLFSNVAHEFMFYSALLAADMIIFALLGYNFKPNKYHSS